MAPMTPCTRKEHRTTSLQKVYTEFDLDGGGDVGSDEMLALGQARRALGQKSGEWTEANNEKLLRHMNADGEGNVTAESFVRCTFIVNLFRSLFLSIVRNIQCASG